MQPQLLLAEDDPVSLAFLTEALRDLGFEVHTVTDGETALEAARTRRFDALMFDRHLPHLDGEAVLLSLRSDESAASRHALAIATTAEPDPAIHARLREAGFLRVLIKPLGGAKLEDALRELGLTCTPALHDLGGALDDQAGLRATGSSQALSALRNLFARELDALANEWSRLQDDALLAERLHRLRAACGFCGARVLQSAAENLSTALREADPARVEGSRTEFQRALSATREALSDPQELACKRS